MDYGHLKLDGTADDDEDDEVTQNKLLILAAKDAKNGNPCCNWSARERSE